MFRDDYFRYYYEKSHFHLLVFSLPGLLTIVSNIERPKRGPWENCTKEDSRLEQIFWFRTYLVFCMRKAGKKLPKHNHFEIFLEVY